MKLVAHTEHGTMHARAHSVSLFKAWFDAVCVRRAWQKRWVFVSPLQQHSDTQAWAVYECDHLVNLHPQQICLFVDCLKFPEAKLARHLNSWVSVWLIDCAWARSEPKQSPKEAVHTTSFNTHRSLPVNGSANLTAGGFQKYFFQLFHQTWDLVPAGAESTASCWRRWEQENRRKLIWAKCVAIFWTILWSKWSFGLWTWIILAWSNLVKHTNSAQEREKTPPSLYFIFFWHLSSRTMLFGFQVFSAVIVVSCSTSTCARQDVHSYVKQFKTKGWCSYVKTIMFRVVTKQMEESGLQLSLVHIKNLLLYMVHTAKNFDTFTNKLFHEPIVRATEVTRPAGQIIINSNKFQKENKKKFSWLFTLDLKLRVNITFFSIKFYTQRSSQKCPVGGVAVSSMGNKIVHCGILSDVISYPHSPNAKIEILRMQYTRFSAEMTYCVMDAGIISTQAYSFRLKRPHMKPKWFWFVHPKSTFIFLHHVVVRKDSVVFFRKPSWGQTFDGPGEKSPEMKSLWNQRFVDSTSFQCIVHHWSRDMKVTMMFEAKVLYFELQRNVKRGVVLKHNNGNCNALESVCFFTYEADKGYLNVTIQEFIFTGEVDNSLCTFAGMAAFDIVSWGSRHSLRWSYETSSFCWHFSWDNRASDIFHLSRCSEKLQGEITVLKKQQTFDFVLQLQRIWKIDISIHHFHHVLFFSHN